MPIKLSGVILNPQFQALMAKLAISLPLPPPPTKPPKMEAAMQISEEMERQSTEKPKEPTKDITKEPEDFDQDDYFKHPKGKVRVNIYKVSSNEEGKQTP